MTQGRNVEVYFEPQDEGGYTAYAPELPGMVTQGETLHEASVMAEEALALYVEDMRERGEQLPKVVRRTFRLPD